MQLGDADELCEHNIFEYVQGLDLKAFSCLHKLLDKALRFKDFRALLAIDPTATMKFTRDLFYERSFSTLLDSGLTFLSSWLIGGL